MNETCYRN